MKTKLKSKKAASAASSSSRLDARQMHLVAVQRIWLRRAYERMQEGDKAQAATAILKATQGLNDLVNDLMTA